MIMACVSKTFLEMPTSHVNLWHFFISQPPVLEMAVRCVRGV